MSSRCGSTMVTSPLGESRKTAASNPGTLSSQMEESSAVSISIDWRNESIRYRLPKSDKGGNA